VSGSPEQEQPKLLLSFPLLSMLCADRPLPMVHMDQTFQLFLKPSQIFHSLCEASSSEVQKDIIEIPGSSIISAPRWSIGRSVPGLGWQQFLGSSQKSRTNTTQLSSLQSFWCLFPSSLQPRSPLIRCF